MEQYEILNGYVLIKPDKLPEMTKGGVALPDVRKEVPQSGICLLGKYKGSKIWYESQVVFPIKLEEEEYVMCREEELLLRVK